MNKQRSVIYKKRSHALFGERLALDLDNAFYQVVEGLVVNHKTMNDYEAFKLGLIVQFGLDSKISFEEFTSAKENDLIELVYQETIGHYEYRKKEMMQNSIPVFKNIRLQQGNHIENVIVPVSDGKTAFNVLVNLDKNIATSGSAFVRANWFVVNHAWQAWVTVIRSLWQMLECRFMIHKGQADLLHVVTALHAACSFTCCLNGW
jgi:preprotein translocase subunit SecA